MDDEAVALCSVSAAWCALCGIWHALRDKRQVGWHGAHAQQPQHVGVLR